MQQPQTERSRVTKGMVLAVLLLIVGISMLGMSVVWLIENSGNESNDVHYEGVISDKIERFLVDRDGTRVFYYLRIDTESGPFDIQVSESQYLQREIGEEFAFTYRYGDATGALAVGGILFGLLAPVVGGTYLHTLWERRRKG